MFNNFKVKIQTLKQLAWDDFRNLFTWPSKSIIQAENQNLLIAKATNQRGEVVGYVTAENVMVIDNYIINPASTDDLQKAGDSIDRALAQRAGATRIWLVIPDEVEQPIKGEKYIRVVERRLSQPITPMQRFAECELKQPVYLN